eukprot:2151474-Rhodomonas_salina.1
MRVHACAYQHTSTVRRTHTAARSETESVAPIVAPYNSSVAPYNSSVAPYKSSLAPYSSSVAPYNSSVAPYSSSVHSLSTCYAPMLRKCSTYHSTIQQLNTVHSVAPYPIAALVVAAYASSVHYHPMFLCYAPMLCSYARLRKAKPKV